MLRALRSGGIVQILMVGVVGAIIAVFVLEFRAAGGSQVGPLSRRCVVTVDGECSSVKDFFASYNLIVPRGMQAKHVKALGLRQHIAQGILERELLLLEADRMGVSVSVKAIDDELAQGLAHVSLPAEHALRLGVTLDLTSGDAEGLSREMVRQLPVKNAKTDAFDPKVYKRTVRNYVRRSPKEFKELQKKELIAARMRDIIRANVRVSEEEAFQAFSRDRSQAVVRVVHLDRGWFARYAVDLSDAAVDAYISKHQADIDAEWKKSVESWAQGCPLVSEILFTAPSGGDDAGDRALARDKALEAKDRIEAGEPFADVARELSDGESAVVGGDLGCLEAERYGAGGGDLVAALDGLKPGAVSDVVETERGMHLLLLRGRLGTDVEQTGRRAIARTRLAMERGGELAQEFGKKLIERVEGGAAHDEAAAALVEDYGSQKLPTGLTKKKSEKKGDESERDPAYRADRRRPRVEISSQFTAGENPIDGALPTTSPAQAAFALEKDGDIHSDLIPTLSGFAVMQLKEKTPATREEFDENKDEIIRQLLISKRADALSAYVDRLRKRYADEIQTDFALIADEGGEEDADA